MNPCQNQLFQASQSKSMRSMKAAVTRWIILTFVLFGARTPSWAGESVNYKLLKNQAVQQELNLTDEQLGKVNSLLAQIDKDKTETEMANLNYRLRPILDQKQTDRLWEIGAQLRLKEPMAEFGMIGDLRTRQILKLTHSQMHDFGMLLNQMDLDVKQLQTKGKLDPNDLKLKTENLRREYGNKLLEVFSEDQRKAFKAMFGKPFDLSLVK